MERGCTGRRWPWPAWRPRAFQQRVLRFHMQPRGAMTGQAVGKNPERRLPFEGAGQRKPPIGSPSGYPTAAVRKQRMCPSAHIFERPKSPLKWSPYLGQINRKVQITLLHESPHLHIKAQSETQIIGAFSKMKW